MPQTKLGFGILTIDVDLLADALYLPAEYRIACIDFDPRTRGIVLTLVSEHLPEVHQPEQNIPHVHLLHTVETLPDASPEYRRITSRIEV